MKVIIIGAGIGGLTAAIYAAKQGFETELYEQHTIVGGECTGWDRGGYHIDNCIHWMMGTTPGTDLYKIWETVGAVGEDIPIKRCDRMYTSELKGKELSLWSDVDRTEKELLDISPEDEKAIRRLMKFCRLATKVEIPARIPSELMGTKDGMKMLFTMRDMMKIFKEYKGMNVQDLMDQFHHPLIKCLISDFTPSDTKASSFAMAYGNFISGDGGIPAGGSRAMAIRMKKTLEAYGGKVFCGTKVAKILLGKDRATGILLEDGTKVTGDYVIPACDTSVAFGKLLDKKYMHPLLKEMYTNRKAYPIYSTFQVAFAVDSPEDAVGAERIWDCEELVFTKGMGERITVKSYSYEPGFAPQGKQILQTLQGGSEEIYQYWTEMYKDKERYNNKKREIAELTKKKLEEKFPTYRGKLTILDVWTPMTYRRYCNAYKGFYQSFMVSKDSAKLPYPPAYIKGINNVILAGQWISPPGGLPGAAITGKFAIQRICKLEDKEYLF